MVESDGGELDRLALGRQCFRNCACLHDGRVQVEIVRHHRCAKDAHGEIQHLRIAHDLHRRREAEDDLAPVGIGQRHLHTEAHGDNQQGRYHEGFDPAEANVLQIKDEEHVERRDEHADLERNAEQQVEADRRADHFGEVGGADGDLGQQPKHVADRLGERVAARLGKVASRGEAETGAQRLQQDRHDVRHQGDAQQRVAELRASGERGCPVAGVHIADGNEVARSEEREETAPADTAYRNTTPTPHAKKARHAPGASHPLRIRSQPYPATSSCPASPLSSRPNRQTFQPSCE